VVRDIFSRSRHLVIIVFLPFTLSGSDPLLYRSHVHKFAGDIDDGLDCTPYVEYFLFAWHVQAVDEGHIVGLVATSILTILYVAMTSDEFYKEYLARRRHRSGKQKHLKELEAQEKWQQEGTEPRQVAATLATAQPNKATNHASSAPLVSGNRFTITGTPGSILMSSHLAPPDPRVMSASGTGNTSIVYSTSESQRENTTAPNATSSPPADEQYDVQQQQKDYTRPSNRQHEQHQYRAHTGRHRDNRHQHKPKHRSVFNIPRQFSSLVPLAFLIISTNQNVAMTYKYMQTMVA
jgi:hypothetical protein